MNAYPWNYPSDDTRQLYCWAATARCANVVSDNLATTVYPLGVASKFPWDVQLDALGNNLGTAQTTGNNVDDARLWSGGHGAFGNPLLFRPISATRDYQPTFTNAWFDSGCNPALVSDPVNNPAANDIEAATVNLFVGHNIMHDYAYYLGFDEGHWNAQQYNNGISTVDSYPSPGGPTATPVGNDGLNGNAQAGAATGSRDNANMGTGADGNHPRTNMFLWQPIAGSFYAPCVDGDYDFGVFGHEFGHMIENRMIGKGVGARQGNAAGAMGEAFGDFDALEVMNALHIAPVPGSDRYTEGAYVTGNPYNGIRDFLAGRPMGGEFPEPGRNPDTDPLNYGDFGFDLPGPEVHADGEIWIAVQIDLRDLFLARHPSSGPAEDVACVRGRLAAASCPGDRRWIQDYYDAMVMMPRNPTMAGARDAMLAADMGRFGGANQDLLWQGFALRGFGQFQNTNGTQDTSPTPDFSSPLADNATLNFFADNKETRSFRSTRRSTWATTRRERRRSPTPTRPPSRAPRPGRTTSTTRRSSCRTRATHAGARTTSSQSRPASGRCGSTCGTCSPARLGTSRSTSHRTSPRRPRRQRSPATPSARTRTLPTCSMTTRARTTARPARTPSAAGS